MAALPDTPQTIVGIFGTGIRIFKAVFLKVLPLLLLQVLLVSGLAFFLSTLSLKDAELALFISVIGLLILSFFLLLVLGSAIVALVDSIVTQKESDYISVLCIGVQKAIPCLFVLILCFFFVGICFTLPSILLLTLSKFMPFSFVIFPIVGFIASLPAIYLSILLYIAPFLVIISDQGIVGSIRQSCYLVSGHWWKTALTLFLITLIASFLSLILFLTPEEAIKIVGPIVSLLSLPLMLSGQMAILYCLRVEKKKLS